MNAQILKCRCNAVACLLTLLVSLTVISCKKFIEAKSNDALVVPSTLKDLQALLDNSRLLNMQCPSFAEASSDDYFLPLDRYNGLPVEEQSRYTWAATDYRFVNDWSYSYSAVYPANICLERINNVPVDAATLLAWNNIKGSALFYRAYHFQQLAAVYAKAWDPSSYNTDLGIVLRTTSDINVTSLRASVHDTYQKIIADVKEAAALLPDNPVHPLRPSRAAAYGLLARTFLLMNMYDSAGRYAALALNIKKNLMDYNNAAQVNLSASQPFAAYNTEVIFHSQINNWNAFFTAQNGALIDTMLISTYQSDDLRLKAFFKVSGSYRSFKGNYAANNNAYFSGIATDEMWLIKAEAEARAGSVPQALASLETLRIKRFAPATYAPLPATSAAEALQSILLERRKELLMRGIRWGDVKRLNRQMPAISLMRLINGQSFILAPNEKRTALPLPVDIIENSNLPQN